VFQRGYINTYSLGNSAKENGVAEKGKGGIPRNNILKNEKYIQETNILKCTLYSFVGHEVV
jgi:hypothetical protein